MQNEINKKKNDLLASILKNPKLAKSFSEAMGAPIGSTKREQAKSVLSIMKKLGGIKNDGQGGIIRNTSQPEPVVKTENYSNMMIFPAAPKFKAKQVEVKPSGQGGPSYDGKGGIFNTISNSGIYGDNGASYGIKRSAPVPKPEYPNIFKGLGDIFKVSDEYKNREPYVPQNRFGGDFNLNQIGGNVLKTIKGEPMVTPTTQQGGAQTGAPVYPTPDGKAPTQSYSNLYQPGGMTPMNGAMTPMNGTAPTAPTAPIGHTTYGTPTGSTTSGTPTSLTDQTGPRDANQLRTDAQRAVNAGTGAGMFSLGVLDERFGGGLQEYLDGIDTKLKNDFGLVPLETELSRLKAAKNNLVPTMQSYIRGKDQYLSAIEKMIDSAEGELLKEDMGNPAVANSYNNYLTYLYTLKGRQNARYGNYLNAAIDDYNAEVERTQSNYENVYNQYENMMTRKSAIAQTEYDTMYNAMSDMYTSLENAPMRLASLEALQLQNLETGSRIANDSLSPSRIDEDHMKDSAAYFKQITDSDGNLNMNRLTASGLEGLFSEIPPEKRMAMTSAISQAIKTTISNSGGDNEKIGEMNELIRTLGNVSGGDTYANQLFASISGSADNSMGSYLIQNIGSVKKAVKNLVKKGGLEDKSKWKNKYSDLGGNLLDELYAGIGNNFEGYEDDPGAYLSRLFSGDDETTAKAIGSILGYNITYDE